MRYSYQNSVPNSVLKLIHKSNLTFKKFILNMKWHYTECHLTAERRTLNNVENPRHIRCPHKLLSIFSISFLNIIIIEIELTATGGATPIGSWSNHYWVWDYMNKVGYTKYSFMMLIQKWKLFMALFLIMHLLDNILH